MGIFRRFFGIEYMLPKNMEHNELPSGKSMYQEYIRLAIPSVLEMVLASLINMMDTMMVSSVGTDAVAAVGLAGQPRLIALCLFFALNTGVTAVVARRRGEERQNDANQVLRNTMIIALGLSFVIMAVMLPFANPLMRFTGAEAGRTLEDSAVYLRIVIWVLPFNTLSMVICAAQRGVGNTKLTMYVNLTSNLINILFNYLLINGIGPFPKLGVKGAAIATAIGLICGFILSLFSLLRHKRPNTFLRITLKDDWRLNRTAVNDVTRIASSAVLETLVTRIGFFVYAKIIASLGTDSFAAHQICAQFLNISFSFADGLGIAGTSLVGQMLGRKRKDLAHIYGKLAQRFSLTVSFGIALCCILLRHQLVAMFISENASDGVEALASYVMIIVGLFQPFQMVAISASGALRGAGDVKYTAFVMGLTVAVMRPILALLCIYGIGTLLGKPEVALLGCWTAALTDIITRMILMLHRYNNGRWHNIRV